MSIPHNTVELLVILFLVLIVLGALPVWPHSANWGYNPLGGIVTLVIVLVILRIFGLI